MKRLISAIASSLFIVSAGCVTVQDTKSLIITPEPGENKIAVTSHAIAKCYDILLIMACNLNMDLKKVEEPKVKEGLK